MYKENKHVFKYKTLALCIMFYFLQGVPYQGTVLWELGMLIDQHI